MSARILIVEDDPGIRELLRVNLQHAGFTPICCESAEAAAAELQLGTPDLIVLDWMLPGRSGIDFAREIRATSRGSDVPLLMLTARAQEGDKLQGFETGADDYMTKPFSPRAHRPGSGAATPGRARNHADTAGIRGVAAGARHLARLLER